MSKSIQSWLSGRTDQTQKTATQSPTGVAMLQTGECVNNTAAAQPRTTPTGAGRANRAPGPTEGNTSSASEQSKGGNGPHIEQATPPNPNPPPCPLQVGGGVNQSKYDYSGPRWLDGRWRDDKDVEGPAAGSFIPVVGLQVDGRWQDGIFTGSFLRQWARGAAGQPADCNF